MAVIGATQLEPVNVLGSYLEGAQVGRANRLARAEEASAVAATQQKNRLEAMIRAGALTTPEGRNALLSEPGGAEMLKMFGQSQEAMGKGLKAETEGISERMQYWKRLLPADPKQAPTWVASAYSDPVVGPELAKLGTAEQVIASIPQDPAKYGQWLEGASLFADEYAKRRVPTAEAMLPYTQALSPEIEAQKARIASAGAARTTVNLPPAGKKFSETLGETAGKRLDMFRDKAESAVQTLQTSQQLQSLLDDPKFISGTFADARLALARAAGIDVSATEAYFAGIGQQVAERITAFGAGTGLSDADREFAKSIAGGNPITTAEGIRQIIRINNESARNIIKRYNDERSRLAKKEPEVEDYYPEINVTRQIKRTGTVDGRRVVEYDDGSVEYAD